MRICMHCKRFAQGRKHMRLCHLKNEYKDFRSTCKDFKASRPEIERLAAIERDKA